MRVWMDENCDCQYVFGNCENLCIFLSLSAIAYGLSSHSTKTCLLCRWCECQMLVYCHCIAYVWYLFLHIYFFSSLLLFYPDLPFSFNFPHSRKLSEFLFIHSFLFSILFISNIFFFCSLLIAVVVRPLLILNRCGCTIYLNTQNVIGLSFDFALSISV